MNDSLITRRLLESYVPLRALSRAHLDTLMREHVVETVLAGTTLFNIGDQDGQALYLLHGSVLLEAANGQQQTLSPEDDLCRFPLAHRQPRQDRALASTDCTLIRFSADWLDSMLCWEQTARNLQLAILAEENPGESARWMLALLDSNLFHKVPPVQVGQVLNAFEAVDAAAGTVILSQGEAGDACYYLKQGSALVQRDGQTLATLEAGQVFGEDALVYDAPRNATVLMQEDGVLMRLNRQDFYRLLQVPADNALDMIAAREAAEAGALWLDVRTQDEFEAGHRPGARHLPLDLLQLKAAFLSPDRDYLLYCNSGRRSAIARQWLTEHGIRAQMLKGGFDAWPEADRAGFLAETGDISLP